MKKIAFAGIIFLLGICQVSLAQNDTTSTKKFIQYAGIQLNPLIRQVFNFNNSNQTTVNPYLINYSINNRNTGQGIRLGVGLNYNQTTTDDGVTKNETNEIDYEIRLGYEKIFRIASRWEIAAGFDLLVNDMNNFTKTTSRDIQTTITQISDINFNYGAGPMAGIRFYATKKILIGTETSLYYTRGNPSESISEFQSFPGQQDRYVSTSTHSFNALMTFSLPVAFYLIAKF